MLSTLFYHKEFAHIFYYNFMDRVQVLTGFESVRNLIAAADGSSPVTRLLLYAGVACLSVIKMLLLFLVTAIGSAGYLLFLSPVTFLAIFWFFFLGGHDCLHYFARHEKNRKASERHMQTVNKKAYCSRKTACGSADSSGKRTANRISASSSASAGRRLSSGQKNIGTEIRYRKLPMYHTGQKQVRRAC